MAAEPIYQFVSDGTIDFQALNSASGGSHATELHKMATDSLALQHHLQQMDRSNPSITVVCECGRPTCWIGSRCNGRNVTAWDSWGKGDIGQIRPNFALKNTGFVQLEKVDDEAWRYRFGYYRGSGMPNRTPSVGGIDFMPWIQIKSTE